jgi:prevent-host-death family protein
MTIAAGEFKAKCLTLMDDVCATRAPVTITKRGKPVAVLAPCPQPKREPLFGCMKGTVRVTGDIITPTGERWEADE